MILNKENKLKYLGKLVELITASYGEIGLIYNVEDIDTFNAVAVKKKYEKVLKILGDIKTVVESGELDQLNETQIRVYFKNQNMFTLDIDNNVFQDFSLVNYFGLPTFDFSNIINTFIYNDNVVRIDGIAEYAITEEGKNQLKANIAAQNAYMQEIAAKQAAGTPVTGIVEKIINKEKPFSIEDNSTSSVPHRFGPAPTAATTEVAPAASVDSHTVQGQSLIPTSVKPVGSWQ